jgi:hypothetical protein
VPPELRLLMCQVTPSTRNCLPLSLFPQRDIFASPAKSAFNVSCPIVIGPLAFVAVLSIGASQNTPAFLESIPFVSDQPTLHVPHSTDTDRQLSQHVVAVLSRLTMLL